MRVAVIPARGGSKRVPRKNIKNFCGKPIIAWSIEAAVKSGCFERIIVSTDDQEISEVAKKYGAEVPFMRPENLSDDYTGTTAVIKHAIEALQKRGEKIKYACCIYATAPFVSVRDLQDAWQRINGSEHDYAFSVTSYAFPIQRAIMVTEQGTISMFNPKHFATRSQELEEAWHDAGQFYWGKAEAWLQEKSLFSGGSVAVKLPRHRVQDIDTQEDWLRAEWLFKALQAVKIDK